MTSLSKIKSIHSPGIRMCDFVLSFSERSMKITNTTKGTSYVQNVYIFDKEGFLAKKEFFIRDIESLHDSIKKVTCVYTGVYDEAIFSGESVLAISLTAKSITTLRDCICLDAKKLGHIATGGITFLRNCPDHNGVLATHINLDTQSSHYKLEPMRSITFYNIKPYSESASKASNFSTKASIAKASSNKKMITSQGEVSLVFKGSKVLLKGITLL